MSWPLDLICQKYKKTTIICNIAECVVTMENTNECCKIDEQEIIEMEKKTMIWIVDKKTDHTKISKYILKLLDTLCFRAKN